MVRYLVMGIGALGLCASVLLAHSGVKNPAVMARMNAMSEIGAGMKVLGEMAKGARDFDAAAAQAAAAGIAAHAAETPGLFEAEEDDPKSEARPEIWVNFADFTAKAEALEQAASKAAAEINGVADLGPALQSLGATCKSCHKAYRE